jgi:hypothetical protein
LSHLVIPATHLAGINRIPFDPRLKIAGMTLVYAHRVI